MKQLLAILCSVLYLHSVGQAPMDVKITSPRTSGEKVLVKALTAIVNREGNKKAPLRKITLASFEYP